MVVIDKRTLVDSVTISKPTGKKDGWGKEGFSYPILLSPVRFDRNFDGPGSVNNPSGQKNPSFRAPGVIFVYPQYCDVEIDSSYRNAIVKDGSDEYIVNKIIPVYEPFNRRVFCYEIEVM